MTSELSKESIRAALGMTDPTPYHQEAIPSDRDLRIARFLQNDVNSDSGARGKLVAMMGEEEAGVLRFFSERMATLAVRRGDVRMVDDGLCALVLSADCSADMREVLLILPLQLDACMRLGKDPKVVFGDVSRRIGDPSGLLPEFLQRRPEDQSIAAMGYEAVGSTTDFSYRRTW